MQNKLMKSNPNQKVSSISKLITFSFRNYMTLFSSRIWEKSCLFWDMNMGFQEPIQIVSHMEIYIVSIVGYEKLGRDCVLLVEVVR